MRVDIISAAKAALGGDIHSGGTSINVPGPGHKSKHDRSLTITVSNSKPEGYVFVSRPGDDFKTCDNYIRKAIGLPEWEPGRRGNLEGFVNPKNFPALKEPPDQFAGGTDDDLPEIPSSIGAPTNFYTYKDEAGRVLGHIYRFDRPEGKTFRPVTPWVFGNAIEWRAKGFPDPHPLYGLDRLAASPGAPVLVVEGEKAADASQALFPDFVATTSPGGALAVGKTNWGPLKGREVTIWPDADEAGEKYAAEVIQKLHAAKVASVSCVDVSDFPPKWDLADAVPEGFDIQVRVASARPAILSVMEVDASNAKVSAKPFKLRPSSEIPPREWIYDRHYARGYVTATVAPGGVGKSALTMVEALSIVTGRKLLHHKPEQICRAWLWNLEDPMDELERRITAATNYHNISADEIDGKLFVNSGRDGDLMIAKTEKGGTVICKPVVENLIAEILNNEIGVLIIDPFVSSHMVNENDNSAINSVIKTFRLIAEQTKCSIELVHHTRKQKPGSNGSVTVDDARGASALHDGTRGMRSVGRMTEEDADQWNISKDSRKSYLRVTKGKPNMNPPNAKSAWYHLASVDLENATERLPSDHIGVVEAWSPPGPFDDVSVSEVRKIAEIIQQGQTGNGVMPFTLKFGSKNPATWAGSVIEQELGCNKAKASKMIDSWIESGLLVEIKFTSNSRNEVVGVRVDNSKLP